jgi:putative ABC transport system permease protein
MVLIGGSVSDVQHAARSGAADLLSSAEIWLKPGGPENVYTTQPIRYAATQRRLEALPEVTSVLPWRDSFLDLKGRRVWVLGVPPQLQAQIAASQMVEGSLTVADRHLREGGWAAISQPIAQERHLRLGQSFSLPTPSGIAHFRLAATIANYGWLSGAIVMNGTDHETLWRSKTATELAVTLRPGISIEQARRAINTALPKETLLAIQTNDERQSEVSAVLGSTLSRLNDTTIVVLVATLASVIALMIAAIWQRQARIEDLDSIGMSTGQFARLIFYESGTVLLCGCIIGVAAGLAAQYLIDGWLHQTTGASVHYAPAWLVGLRTFGVAGGISALATFVAVLQTVEFQRRRTPSAE